MAKRLFALTLILLLLVPSLIMAQSEVPPITDTMTIENETASVTIGVPEGWETAVVELTEEADPYGFMSNVANLSPDGAPMVVQVAIRPVDTLDVEVDTEVTNPAMAYFEQYAVTSGLDGKGAYAVPVALRDGDVRAALMLYVEGNSAVYFKDYEQILSLGFASYVGDDQMLIILFEGAAEKWIDLLVMWNILLGSLQINQRLLEFEDLPQILIGFESAESLVERYVNQDTLPPGVVPILPMGGEQGILLRMAQDEVIIPIPQDWTPVEQDDPLKAIVEAEDEKITAWVSLKQADFVSTLDLIQQQDTVEGVSLFLTWDTLPTAAAPTEDGAFVIAELPGGSGLLWLQYETDQDDWQTWLDFLAQIRINSKNLKFDNVWGAMFQFQE